MTREELILLLQTFAVDGGTTLTEAEAKEIVDTILVRSTK